MAKFPRWSVVQCRVDSSKQYHTQGDPARLIQSYVSQILQQVGSFAIVSSWDFRSLSCIAYTHSFLYWSERGKKSAVSKLSIDALSGSSKKPTVIFQKAIFDQAFWPNDIWIDPSIGTLIVSNGATEKKTTIHCQLKSVIFLFASQLFKLNHAFNAIQT